LSQRQTLELQQKRLGEIGKIMGAMKTMAFMETLKLTRFLDHQQMLLGNIESVIADFLHFYPTAAGHFKASGMDRHLLIAIGSERGFCGDFNERMAVAIAGLAGHNHKLLIIGRRLAIKFKDHPSVLTSRDGVTVAEELDSVLNELVSEILNILTSTRTLTGLTVIAHDHSGEIVSQSILPISISRSVSHSYPPKLNLEPAAFFSELIGFYLNAKLPTLFQNSLLTENRRRLEHMEHALKRIEEKIQKLDRRRKSLRQEEIIEEIEVILLNDLSAKNTVRY
jgi:F-type H+-transporting ATPase subunit gamma